MTAVGPVAVVTGAGSAIGRAVAAGLLADGYRVALLGRRRSALEESARQAGTGEAMVLATDVTERDQVQAAFDAVVAAWGRIDLLFNNAGTFGRGGPIEEVDLDSFDEVMAVNVSGAMSCAQAAYRVMLQQEPGGGRIINNGSLSAHVPRMNAVAYTTSKHAITGLTRAIALEGRRHRIACGQIDIGNVSTDLASTSGADRL